MGRPNRLLASQNGHRYRNKVPTRALVVSLHDVSPLTFATCRRIVQELETLEVDRISLLVIADHHGRGHFAADSEFCDWLRSCSAARHEIVTHGYYHQRERRGGESLRQQLTTRFYTADEGEFYDIATPEALCRVRKANEELRGAGLTPRGFIAPAWLLGSEGEEALRQLGCEYTTRLRAVHDLRDNRTFPSQSLCWSVRSGWRRLLSRGWNAVLARRLASNPLLRIAVHPVDIQHGAIWHQIRRITADALRTRVPMTYLQWVLEQRTLDSQSANSQSCCT